MEKKYDLAALGEILIDFTESGRSSSGMRIFEQNPGGAVTNVLCAAAKLGKKTAFIGKVGDDMHGRFLQETIVNAGVDASGMVVGQDVFTTLAFVALTETGERSFSFARKPGADTQLSPSELNMGIVRNCKVFHIGSLSLTDEPSRSATLYAVNEAKKSGAIISYDPNYRASLWESRDKAMYQMRSILKDVDIIKISDEETELLTDKKSPEEAAAELVMNGIPCAAVTLGKDGALVCTRDGTRAVPTFPGKTVDTTGAGDSFWGAFLYRLIESGKHPLDLTLSEAEDFVRFGNAAATLCVGKRGAIPALPSLGEIGKLLNES
jgi:fructokinase